MNLETLKPRLARFGRFLLAAIAATARAAWAVILWTLTTLWVVTKWAGRVALWVVFWPLGLWRSWRHGANRRDARLAAAIARAQNVRR